MSDLQVIGLATVLGMLAAAGIVAALVCNAEDWFHDGVNPWISPMDKEFSRQLRHIADSSLLPERDKHWLRSAAAHIEFHGKKHA